jgi:nucleosome assembly protein 1-like 1
LAADEVAKYKLAAYEDGETGMPGYWKQVLINSTYFDVNENDKNILTHLKDIKLVDHDDRLSFTVNFEFTPNEYFNNNVLTKTYHYEFDGQDLHQVDATKVDWKSEDKIPNKIVHTKKIKSNKQINFRGKEN